MTSPSTAASTSTPATASNWTKATKVGLRKKGATLQAVRVTTAHPVTLPDETTVVPKPGDWIIMQGSSGIVVDCLKAADFPGPYEIVADGTLLLTKEQREDLEQVTGIGTTRTPIELLQAVRRLARIQVGEVVVPFTPGQLEELKHRADKRGQTLQQAMQAVVDRLKDEIFWKG